MGKFKITLNVDDELWKQVKIYSIQHNFINLNETVIHLIKQGIRGLEQNGEVRDKD